MSEEEKQELSVFETHREFGRRLAVLVKQWHFVIEDFHTHKCVFKRNKYRLNSTADKLIYDKLLYLNKNKFCSYDTFPCTFKSEMEIVMLNEDPSIGDDFGDAYFHGSRHEATRILMSASPTMEPADVTRIVILIECMIAWMTEAITLHMTTFAHSREIWRKRMNKERNRLQKIIDKFRDSYTYT